MSSHAEPPKRRQSSKLSAEQHPRSDASASAAELPQMNDNITTFTQQHPSSQDPMAQVDSFTTGPTNLLANIDEDTDIDVPPDMHNATRPVTFPTVDITPDGGFSMNTASPSHQNEVTHSSAGTASLMRLNSALFRNNDIETGLVPQTPADPRSRPFELPHELFDSPVDVHTRKWLRDFCADG